MLSQEARQGGLFVQACEANALVAGCFAGDDLDVAAGDLESFRQEGHEGVVGGAVDRRRREADAQGAAAHAVDTAARGPWDDADVQDAPRVRTSASGGVSWTLCARRHGRPAPAAWLCSGPRAVRPAAGG